MTGATIPAAKKPAAKSEATRSPRFLVFHSLDCFRGVATLGTVGAGGFDGDDGSGGSGEIFDMGISMPGVGELITCAFGRDRFLMVDG